MQFDTRNVVVEKMSDGAEDPEVMRFAPEGGWWGPHLARFKACRAVKLMRDNL
ncbi:MAG: hypothetical protein WC205_10035 [Opitutaceae bacterium]